MKQNTPEINWGSGYLCGQDATPNLEGRILTIIESLGLQAKQEEAVKSLVRKDLWEWHYNFMLYVPQEIHNKTRKVVHEWEVKNLPSAGIPVRSAR